MPILKDLHNAYKNANSVEKIIYLNILVFFINLLFQNVLFNWLALSTNTSNLVLKPWTAVSYAFLHKDLFHILSNLIVLFYIGNLFLNFFTKKQFITVYFFGILAGALFFLFGTKTGYLIGASAGITAIFVAIATKIPHYALRLRFIGSVELWVLAAVWVVLSLLQVSANTNNTGGQLAHLGGAFIGFMYTKQLQKGNNIGKGFENLQDWISSFFRKEKKKSALKTVYKSNTTIQQKENNSKQRKINTILDKIGKSGYDSLSKEEKEFLFKAGNN